MQNRAYGRAVPRLALAVAEYVKRFGQWPTNAHGLGVMKIVEVSEDLDDYEHQSELRGELAERVLTRLVCDSDGEWINAIGPAGICSYGLVARDEPFVAEAYHRLYYKDPWWLRHL